MDLEPGIKVTDNVRLVRPIGEGAMGSVWVGEHEGLKTEVAVKFIHEELSEGRNDAIERFRREARAAAQIKTPHVVQMFDHGVMEGGTPYIVMELLDGESLHDRLDRAGWLSPEETLTVLTHVARALSIAHARGVIHRDIKPHNIWLSEVHGELLCKVLDFGIAKQTRLSQELTEPGTIVGTPQYVSRDLIMHGDSKTIDEQVDLWSMCVVAYKCLTTVLPFDGDSIGKICAALAASDFEPPSKHRPDLGKRYDRWFKRAFDTEVENRFADADELVATFKQVVEGHDDEFDDDTPIPETATPAPTGWRSSKMAIVVVGSLAIGAAVGVGLFRPPTPTETTGTGSGAAALASAAPTTPATSAEVITASAGADQATTASLVTSAASAALAPTASASAGAPPPPIPGMIWIPAGELWMGCHNDRDLDCDNDETPGHTVFVDGFHIDRTEVSVSEYAKCVVDRACSDRRLRGYSIEGDNFVPSTRCNWKQPNKARHPINCVSHAQAERYCEWRNGRLPTEAEWERAARGDDKRDYPWGNEPATCLLTVMAEQGDKGCGKNGTWAVGAQPRDTSPFGVLDMAGNVREWVSDWYDKRFYKTSPTENPIGPEAGARRVSRGGGWGNAVSRFMRVSRRENEDPRSRNMHLGFRCAVGPSPASGTSQVDTSSDGGAGGHAAASGGGGRGGDGGEAP